MPYEAKDYARLLGTEGFSDQLLNNHFTLYKGYVANTNALVVIGKRAQGDIIERYQKLELRSPAERRGETKAETIKEQQLKLPILRVACRP